MFHCFYFYVSWCLMMVEGVKIIDWINDGWYKKVWIKMRKLYTRKDDTRVEWFIKRHSIVFFLCLLLFPFSFMLGIFELIVMKCVKDKYENKQTHTHTHITL